MAKLLDTGIINSGASRVLKMLNGFEVFASDDGGVTVRAGRLMEVTVYMAGDARGKSRKMLAVRSVGDVFETFKNTTPVSLFQLATQNNGAKSGEGEGLVERTCVPRFTLNICWT